MKIFIGAAFLVLGLALSPAWAAGAGEPNTGGSNIALVQYPAPTCVKPQRDDVIEPKMAMRYNTLVTAYNACMKQYVENANSDMTRIQATVKAAVAAANTPDTK